MTPRRPRFLAIALASTAALASCGDDGSPVATAGPASSTERVAPSTAAGRNAPTTNRAAPVIDPGDGGAYAPVVDPADFVDAIDNPYLPLIPGSRWVHEGTSDGERERVEVVVTNDRKQVMGIAATVVRDTVFVDGEMVEDTYDWFAQDNEGNVWYLGEDVKNYEDGALLDTAGSWEAGVGGALPGVVMPAAPAVGTAYRQEFWPGEAEDLGEVIATGGRASVPAGSFDDVITTRDWTPLEADVIEEKLYAAGVGQIRETTVAGGEGVIELIEYTRGE